MNAIIHGNSYYHMFKWRRFSAYMSASISAGGRQGCTASMFSHTTASGDTIPYSMIQEIDNTEYIAIGFAGFYGGNGNFSFRQLQLLYPYLNADMIVVRNSSTSALSKKTATVDVIFMKKHPDAMIYEVKNGEFCRRVVDQNGTQSLVVISDD